MIHLQLQPEIEAQLAAEAAACGLQLDRYLEEIVAARPQPLHELQLQEELEQGLREIAEGKTRPAEEVFAELHRQYGIPG